MLSDAKATISRESKKSKQLDAIVEDDGRGKVAATKYEENHLYNGGRRQSRRDFPYAFMFKNGIASRARST